MVILCICLEESIYHFDSCCDLHQNRSLGRSLCYIGGIAFVVSVVALNVVVAVLVAVAVAIGTADYHSIQDSHVALLYLRLVVSSFLFFG